MSGFTRLAAPVWLTKWPGERSSALTLITINTQTDGRTNNTQQYILKTNAHTKCSVVQLKRKQEFPDKFSENYILAENKN